MAHTCARSARSTCPEPCGLLLWQVALIALICDVYARDLVTKSSLVSFVFWAVIFGQSNTRPGAFDFAYVDTGLQSLLMLQALASGT